MTTRASRTRQRQRRRAQRSVWTLQRALAVKQGDLAAYDRALADMATRSFLPSSGGTAFQIVRLCRDAVARECTELLDRITAAQAKRVKLTVASDPKRTMSP